MVGRMWTRDISRVGAQVVRSLVAAVVAGPDNPILNTVHYGLLQVAKQQEVVPKQVIDPGKLVSQAYAIASRDGISALSARKVARHETTPDHPRRHRVADRRSERRPTRCVRGHRHARSHNDHRPRPRWRSGSNLLRLPLDVLQAREEECPAHCRP